MKKLKILSIFLCIVFLLSGCSAQNITPQYNPSETRSSPDFRLLGAEKLDDETSGKIEKRCLEIADLYQSQYHTAKKKKPELRYEQSSVSDTDLEKIKATLLEKGVSVIDANGDETSTLLNPEPFSDFWNNVSAQQDAELEAIALSEYGGFYYYLFSYHSGKRYFAYANLEWDTAGRPKVKDFQKTSIDSWLYTENGNFMYTRTTGCAAPHVFEKMGRCQLLRIEPVPNALLQYSLAYIAPVGYKGNNLLISDWSEPDFGSLNFNDLLEYLKKLGTGSYLSPKDYPFDEQSDNFYIPRSEFEAVILPFFNMTAPQLKKAASCDEDRNAYPWQEYKGTNTYPNPTLYPNVIASQKNSDGTLTLTVDAICPEKETDALFTHKLTVRPLEDGGFQYVSNAITAGNEEDIPVYFPRVREQRDEGFRDYWQHAR